jgi:hypothetical protein
MKPRRLPGRSLQAIAQALRRLIPMTCPKDPVRPRATLVLKKTRPRVRERSQTLRRRTLGNRQKRPPNMRAQGKKWLRMGQGEVRHKAKPAQIEAKRRPIKALVPVRKGRRAQIGQILGDRVGREEMMLDKKPSREGRALSPQAKARLIPAVKAQVLVNRARKAKDREPSPKGQEINRLKGTVSALPAPIFRG